MHHMSAAASERCNACNKVFNDNDELEIHMAEQHTDQADCARCNAFFKSEEDVMRHANKCSEVLSLNICNKCDREVISKAAHKKHMQTCKGKKQPALCRNGEACRYHKANKCDFLHPVKNQHMQPNPTMNQRPSQVTQKKQPALRPNQQQQQHRPNQEWATVQRRNRNRNPLWTCNFCDQNIYNMEASRGHRVENGNCVVRENQALKVLPHRRQQLWCKFQDSCNKGLACGFRHLEGFPKRRQPQNHH